MNIRKKVLIAALAMSMIIAPNYGNKISYASSSEVPAVIDNSASGEQANTNQPATNTEPITTNVNGNVSPEVSTEAPMDASSSSDVNTKPQIESEKLSDDETQDFLLYIINKIDKFKNKKDEKLLNLENFKNLINIKDEFKKNIKDNPENNLDNQKLVSILEQIVKTQFFNDLNSYITELNNKEENEKYISELDAFSKELSSIIIEEVKENENVKKVVSINKANETKENINGKIKIYKEELISDINELLSIVRYKIKSDEYKSRLKDLNQADIDNLKKSIANIANIADIKNEKLDTIRVYKIKKAYDNLDDSFDKILQEILKDNQSRLKENVEKLEKLIKDNEAKIKKEKLDSIKADLVLAKNLLEKIEKNSSEVNDEEVNSYLTKINNYIKEIEDIKNNFDLDKFKSALETEKLNYSTKKLEEDFKKSSQAKKDAYKNAIDKAEEYLKNVTENKETFDSSKALGFIKDIQTKASEMDGSKFEEELKALREKLVANKDKISKEDYEKFDKAIKEIEDNKKDKTMDDISKISTEIQNIIDKKATLKPSENTGKNGKGIVTKKVNVPRTGTTKKPKSIVRTGIDSIKIFGIVAAVALALLVVTMKKKKK